MQLEYPKHRNTHDSRQSSTYPVAHIVIAGSVHVEIAPFLEHALFDVGSRFSAMGGDSAELCCLKLVLIIKKHFSLSTII